MLIQSVQRLLGLTQTAHTLTTTANAAKTADSTVGAIIEQLVPLKLPIGLFGSLKLHRRQLDEHYRYA